MRDDLKWCVVSHWETSGHLWRMDYVKDPSELFRKLIICYYERLFVIKAFEVTPKYQAVLEERFADCRKEDDWYAPRPALRRFIEQEVACSTFEAKKLYDIGHRRICWQPARPDKQATLERLRLDSDLPVFVTNAKRFVLWAIDDVKGAGMGCWSRDLIGHPSNQIYTARTIYNTITTLLNERKITKTRERMLALTEKGEQELEGLRKIWELKQKKNPRSLRV
jgi:hypothetical protein